MAWPYDDKPISSAAGLDPRFLDFLVRIAEAKGGQKSPAGVTFDAPPPQSVNALMARMLPAPQGSQNALADPMQIPLDERGQPVVNIPPGFGQSPMQVPQQGSTNPMLQYLRGIGRDIAADPWGAAIDGPLTFLGAGAGTGDVANAMLRPFDAAAHGLVRRELRSYTESGARKNNMEASRFAGQRNAERAAQRTDAFNRDADVALSRQPHWEVQGKDPRTGQFQSLTPEARAARERGVEKRAREQRSTDRANDLNKFSN